MALVFLLTYGDINAAGCIYTYDTIYLFNKTVSKSYLPKEYQILLCL